MMSHNKYYYKLMLDDLRSATVIPRSPKLQETIRKYTESELYNLPLFPKNDIVYTEGLMVAKYDVLDREIQVNNHLDITVEIHAGIG